LDSVGCLKHYLIWFALLTNNAINFRAFYTFETDVALGQGFVRLQKDTDGTYKAFTLSFLMQSLKGHPELAGHNRPHGVTHGPVRAQANWLDERLIEQEFPNNDPQVIIVGSGHSGLFLAARLKRLGIRTLLVEKNKRLGDSWRKRYHTLVLHDVVWANHFPYMPFPDSFPVYIPKDK
jgi:hypothetical protein